MVIQTKYCDHCEHIVRLTEDGYCTECGKHADNMHRNPGGYEAESGEYYPANHIDPDYDNFCDSIPDEWYDDDEFEIGGEG